MVPMESRWLPSRWNLQRPSENSWRAGALTMESPKKMLASNLGRRTARMGSSLNPILWWHEPLREQSEKFEALAIFPSILYFWVIWGATADDIGFCTHLHNALCHIWSHYFFPFAKGFNIPNAFVRFICPFSTPKPLNKGSYEYQCFQRSSRKMTRGRV